MPGTMTPKSRSILAIAAVSLLVGLLTLAACGSEKTPAPTQAPAAPTALPTRPAPAPVQPTAPPVAAAQPVAPVAPAQPAPAAAAATSSGIYDKMSLEQWAAHMRVKVVDVLDPSGPPAYAPNDGDVYFFTNSSTTWGATNTRNSVVIIDAKTKKPVAVSDIDPKYAEGFGSHNLGVSADGKWVYLPSLKGATNYLLILDARTLKIAKVLQSTGEGIEPASGRPHHVGNFRSSDGRDLIMVTDFNWNFGGAGFYILDPAQDNAVVGGMTNGDLHGGPYNMVPSPDGKFIYATMPGGVGSNPGRGMREIESATFKIDPKTWTVKANYWPQGDPNWPCISRDGKTLWVTLGGPGKVVKIDTVKDEEVAEVTTGPGPYGCQLSYDETKLYVADKGEAPGYGQQARTVTVIDTRTHTVIKQIAPVGRTTDHVVLSPDGGEIWAQSNADHSIWVIDTETDEVKEVIQMPNDGDVHGGAFVRFSSAGTEMKAEVVGDIFGLWGSAAQAQTAYITNPSRFTISVTRDGLVPNSLTARPGATLTLKFIQSAGTGRVVGVEGPTLGISRFTLRSGDTKTIDVTVPAQPGSYPVVDPTNRNATPLTITVKAEAAVTAPSAAAPGTREIKVVGKNIAFDVKAITGKPSERLKITLLNEDDEPHNIVGIEARLVTDLIQPNKQGTSEWTLPEMAGVYKLFCSIHPSMVINLEVK